MEQQQESEAKECSRCRKSLSPQSVFCPVCGMRVQSTTPENAQTQQQLSQAIPASSPRQSSQQQQKVISIYFSYAHEDKALLDKLEKHLIDLKYSGLIKTWHAQEVSAGQNYVEQVSTQLDQANIILLLISVYFMASPYCYEIEMTRAFERHKRKEVDIIPILLRPVLFDNAPFAHLNKLPKNGKFVTRWSNRDNAFLDIAKEIQQMVKGQQVVSDYVASPTQFVPPPVQTANPPATTPQTSIKLSDQRANNRGSPFVAPPNPNTPNQTLHSGPTIATTPQTPSGNPFTPSPQRTSDTPTAVHSWPATSTREKNRLFRGRTWFIWRRTWFIGVTLFLILLILIYHVGILLFLHTYGLRLTLVLAGLLALFGIVSIGRKVARRRAQQKREAVRKAEEARRRAEAIRREEARRRAKAEQEESQRQAEIPGYEYYKAAVLMYQNALKKDAADTVAYRGLGNAYMGMHAYPEARQAFLRALWFAIEQPACFVGLGDTYAGTKSFREALAAYEKALEIDPAYAPAYGHLHDFFIEWEKPEKASEVAKRARQYGYEIED